MTKWAGKFFLKYQKFLEENRLPAAKTEEMKCLLNGMELFIDAFQQQTNQHWQHFMQQLGQFWLAEEYMARPQVSILNLELSKEDIAYCSEAHFEIPEFMLLENALKQPIGYSGAKACHVYPLLYLEEAKFVSTQECRWDLVYHNEDIPENFKNLSIFLKWPKNKDRIYEILWFLKNAQSEDNIHLEFPIHTFTYPEDEVTLPYKYSWKDLVPYPTSLDFFFEIKGLQKSNFRWDDQDGVWRCALTWKNTTPLRHIKDVPNTLFKLHSYPLYHWIKKDINAVIKRDRIRLLKIEKDDIIWIKAGHHELMPLPYYLHYSLDNKVTSYIKFRKQFLEVEIVPVHITDPEAQTAPLLIQALMSQDFNGEFIDHNLLKVQALETIESQKISHSFLSDLEEKESTQENKKKLLKSHHQFWNTWRMALKQWDEKNLISSAKQYFENLLMKDIEITVGTVTMKHIINKGVFPIVPITFRAKDINGKLWFTLKRLHAYLKERSPIFVLPYFEIKDKHNTICIFDSEI